ncbi:MT-A70 family methyltransferase [Rhizobium sp. RU36D]|uniref:MT-A70 family methyltransferase n=1 Tax=Rhizobium sp. RU36D TaxID=1907415 RepID=UPI001FCCEF2C|nr:MT-A70 family methyltransferase [Rhizobium sp. RU36D]
MEVAAIQIGKRLRYFDQAKVDAIKASIREIGLKTPITLRVVPAGEDGTDHLALVAGMHRLEAMRQLGEEWIPAFVVEGDALDAELWEIDENLCRAELTVADRALFTARRKELYLEKYPDTALGQNQHTRVRKVYEPSICQPKRFTAATAEATGRSESLVQKDVSRGESISEMALHRLRGTRLDSGVFLDRLKQVDPDKQILYVEAALAEEKQKAADTKENRRKLSEVRHAVRLTHMSFVQANGSAKAGQVAHKYPIIYADPPWQFGVRSEVTGRDKSAENHYPTMPTGAICDLFPEIGAPAKADCVLFLWATNPMLPDGLRVMEAWGFTYVHHWIWDKEVAGTGYWGRDRHELLLIGKRGSPVAPLPGTQPQTVHREAKGQHSAKPQFFAETIEHLFPGVPKLELFNRRESLVEGDVRLNGKWDFWGFEAAGTDGEVAA